MKPKEEECLIKINFRQLKREEATYDSDEKDGESFVFDINIYRDLNEIVDSCYHEFTHFICEKFLKKINAKTQERLCKRVAKGATKALGNTIKKEQRKILD